MLGGRETGRTAAWSPTATTPGRRVKRKELNRSFLEWPLGFVAVPVTSELRLLRHAREWDDMPHVLHAGGVHDRALEAQAEAGMGDGAVAAEVAVPVVTPLVQAHLVHALVEDAQALLALGAADDL